MTRASHLVAHLQGRRAEMIALLERLVGEESPSTDPGAQSGVQGLLSEELVRRGFRVLRQRGRDTGGLLLASPAERERGRPLQLLLGHADTVWPLGTLAARAAGLEGDRFVGPGSYDMKAGLVQGLFAIDALREVRGREPEVTPLVLVNSDEEIGSEESTPHILRLARRVDRVFVLEPSIGEAGRLKTERKGVGRFTVRIEGKAAHAGLDPDAGASAILELSHVVQQLFSLNDRERGVTVNVGTIDGGLRPNVVAPESRAVVDVRVRTEEDARRTEEALRALEPTTPGTRLVVEGGMRRPPMERTPGNLRLWEVACVAAAELGVPLEEGAAGGGSDGNTTSRVAPTLDGLGPVGDGAHAPHEFLYVDRMIERAALLALLLDAPPLEVER